MLRVAAAVAGVVVASLMSASAFAQTRPPRVSISGDLGRLFFDVRCAQVAQVPVTIALRGPRNRTFKLDRPCGTWTASSAAMPNVAPRTISRHDTAAEDFLTEPDLVSRLELTATGSRTIRRVYDYTVKVDGVTQTAGKIIVRTSPAESSVSSKAPTPSRTTAVTGGAASSQAAGCCTAPVLRVSPA